MINSYLLLVFKYSIIVFLFLITTFEIMISKLPLYQLFVPSEFEMVFSITTISSTIITPMG